MKLPSFSLSGFTIGIAGLALSLATSLVKGYSDDEKMKKAVAEEVSKALAQQKRREP